MSTEELRCPIPFRGKGKLFAKVLGGKFIEIACLDCKRRMEVESPNLKHVCHYFYLNGEYATTFIKYSDGEEEEIDQRD